MGSQWQHLWWQRFAFILKPVIWRMWYVVLRSIEYVGTKSRLCRWSGLHAGTCFVLYRSWFLHNTYYRMTASTLRTHRNALRWALFPSLPHSVELFFPAGKFTWVFSSWMMVDSVVELLILSDCWQLSCARNKCVLLRLALANSFQLFLLDDASLNSPTYNSAVKCFPCSFSAVLTLDLHSVMLSTSMWTCPLVTHLS